MIIKRLFQALDGDKLNITEMMDTEYIVDRINTHLEMDGDEEWPEDEIKRFALIYQQNR